MLDALQRSCGVQVHGTPPQLRSTTFPNPLPGTLQRITNQARTESPLSLTEATPADLVSPTRRRRGGIKERKRKQQSKTSPLPASGKWTDEACENPFGSTPTGPTPSEPHQDKGVVVSDETPRSGQRWHEGLGLGDAAPQVLHRKAVPVKGDPVTALRPSEWASMVTVAAARQTAAGMTRPAPGTAAYIQQMAKIPTSAPPERELWDSPPLAETGAQGELGDGPPQQPTARVTTVQQRAGSGSDDLDFDPDTDGDSGTTSDSEEIPRSTAIAAQTQADPPKQAAAAPASKRNISYNEYQQNATAAPAATPNDRQTPPAPPPPSADDNATRMMKEIGGWQLRAMKHRHQAEVLDLRVVERRRDLSKGTQLLLAAIASTPKPQPDDQQTAAPVGAKKRHAKDDQRSPPSPDRRKPEKAKDTGTGSRSKGVRVKQQSKSDTHHRQQQQTTDRRSQQARLPR